MTENLSTVSFPLCDPSECPSCGQRDLSSRPELQEFPYGIAADQVTLSARVLVYTCRHCGIRFTDETAEDARHAAVCRCLGVLTPQEIMAIRKRHGYSRNEFARVTLLGEASLARWENGLIVQNAGNDQLLYLLSFDDNIDRVKARRRHEPLEAGNPVSGQAASPRGTKLRVLKPTPERERDAERFRLRIAS